MSIPFVEFCLLVPAGFWSGSDELLFKLLPENIVKYINLQGRKMFALD